MPPSPTLTPKAPSCRRFLPAGSGLLWRRRDGAQRPLSLLYISPLLDLILAALITRPQLGNPSLPPPSPVQPPANSGVASQGRGFNRSATSSPIATTRSSSAGSLVAILPRGWFRSPVFFRHRRALVCFPFLLCFLYNLHKHYLDLLRLQLDSAVSGCSGS